MFLEVISIPFHFKCSAVMNAIFSTFPLLNGQSNIWSIGNIHARIMTGRVSSCCWTGARNAAEREKCQDQDSGELTGKMSPVTRPGGRQLFLFPPGSGSGGSWVKLCWGWERGRGWHRYLMRLGKCLQLWPQICVMDSGDWFSLLLLSLLLFTFLQQRLLGLGDLGFPASHYPECRPWCCLLSLSHSWHRTGADHDAPRSWSDITH